MCGLGVRMSPKATIFSTSEAACDVYDAGDDAGECTWASLPPELLRDVIARVEASDSSWPGRRSVVACAGVCRSWRELTRELRQSQGSYEPSGQITISDELRKPRPGPARSRIHHPHFLPSPLSRFPISPLPPLPRIPPFPRSHLPPISARDSELLQSQGSYESSGQITFPDELRTPGPRDRCVECFIRRSRKTGTFTLFLGVPPNSTENGKFLLAARKCGWRPSSCIGSPFPGSSAHSCGGGAGGGSSGGIGGGSGGGSGGSGGSSGPVVSVAYALNVLGVRGPRRILCTLHQVPAGAAVTGGGGSGAAGAGRGAGGKAGRGTGEEAGGGRGEGRSLARGTSGGSGRGWGDASAVAEAAGEAAAEGARRAAAAAADVAGTAAAALGLDPVTGTSDTGTLRSPRPATLPPVTTSDRSSVSTPPVTVPPSTPPPATPSPATAAVLAAGAAAAAATSPLLSSLFHSNRYSHTRYSNHSCDLPEEQKSDEQAPGQSQPPTFTSSFTPSPLPRPSWPSSPASSPSAAHPAGATSAPPHFPAPSALHSPASPPDVLIAPTGSSASPSPSASASAAPPCPASAFPPCSKLPSSALSSASPAARSCAYRLSGGKGEAGGIVKSGEEMSAGNGVVGRSGKESDEQQSGREEGSQAEGRWEKRNQEESSPEDGSLEEGNRQEGCGHWRTDGACEQQESSGERRSEQAGQQQGWLQGGAPLEPMVLRNKPPRWHEQLQCWCLNFRGRVTVASVKNFQLIEGGGPGNDSDKPVLLQFGKIGKDTFTMDYRYPLTAFQAFAICLSSFDTKVAVQFSSTPALSMATSASAAPEAWLQNQLLAMRDALPFLDSDMVSGLVSYCPNASDADVAEYLSNIVGESDQSMAVVSGYLERRRQMKQGGSPSQPPQNPPRNARGKQQHRQQQQQQQQQQAQDYSHTKYSHENPNIEVYVKPKFDEASGSVSAPSRRTGAGGGLGEGGSAGGAGAPEGAAASGAAGGKVGGRTGGGVGGGAGGSASGGKSAGGRKRRGGLAVGLADLEQGRVFKQGAPCECQAAIHHLVNNCLACGKIVCEQEGEGPCKFCGFLVLRGSDSMGDAAPGVGMEGEWEEWDEVGGVGGAATGTTEAEAKALAFRDRLVEYNRTSAQRTVVIDDQSDYFKSNGADGDGDAWLTNEEREILRRREEEREREEEERRRRVVVTLDLIGRRVLVADSAGADVAGGGADAAGSAGAKSGQEGSEEQTKGASRGANGKPGGGRTGVGSIFLMRGQGGQGDKEQGEREQIPTVKQEVVSGIKVLIKGEGGGGGGSAAGGSGRTQLMPSPNLPIAAPVFVKPSSTNSSTNGAGAGGAGAGGASTTDATGQGKKGSKGKKGQQEQHHGKEQESDRRRGAYKEGMARLQHDSPLMEAMREIEEEVGGRSGWGGNRRIDKERGSRGGGMGSHGVGYRGVSVGEGGGRGGIGRGAAGGGLDSRENRDRDGPCGIPADLAGLADLADDEADVDGRFDICVQMDQQGGLLRGVGGVRGGRGVKAGIDGGRGGVLQDGVVLLKGWLTREQQVN
ncbi:unnamed protein product [Closterium sp. NIES-65]|nr:unnamed protein product [Closterium sp. NIES-65]